MIIRTLLLALSLLIVYNIILKIWPIPLVAQNPMQKNAVIAQEFISTSYLPRNVVVGSSLSSGLAIDSLPGFYNLAFLGQGVIDGLALIDYKKVKPDTVFIETNKFFRSYEQSFMDDFSNPVLSRLRKAVPSFRYGNQFLIKARYFLTRNLNLLVRTKHADPTTNPMFCSVNTLVRDPSAHIDTPVLQENIKKYRQGISKWQLNLQIKVLKTYVNKLQHQNITVVFYETPVNPALEHTKESETVRRIIRNNFPPERYNYIPVPDSKDYLTKDGLHLTRSDQLRYITYFCKWLSDHR